MARLLDEEIAKGRDGLSAKRGDFLARYARVVHHHDLVKPLTSPPSEPLEASVKTKPAARAGRSAGSAQVQATPMPKEASAPALSLTSGLAPPAEAKPSVGFAELLFRGTSETEPASGPDWAKTAVDAPPTIHANEALLPPDDFVPLWLRAAVFLGGSMIVGGLLAHFTGQALWQKKGPPPVLKPATQQVEARYTVPKAVPLPKAAAVPSAVEVPEPAAAPAPAPSMSGGGLLSPPKSGLKRDLEGDIAPPR